MADSDNCTHVKVYHSDEMNTEPTAHLTSHVHALLLKHITKAMCAAANDSTSFVFPNICSAEPG